MMKKKAKVGEKLPKDIADIQEEQKGIRMDKPVMLDGFRGGINIDVESLGLEICKKIHDSLRDQLIAAGARSLKNETTLNIAAHGTAAMVQIREVTRIVGREKTPRSKYYFNIGGNPVSFLSGSNVYGTYQIGPLIRKFFRLIVKRLAEINVSIDKEIIESVKSGNISVYNVTFAAYTTYLSSGKPQTDLRVDDGTDPVISNAFVALSQLYNSGLPLIKQGKCRRTQLKHTLGLEVVDYTPPGSSGLANESFQHGIVFKKYWKNTPNLGLTISFYNKNKERWDNKTEDPIDDLRGRVRIDLMLHNKYLANTKHQVTINGQSQERAIETLADLEAICTPKWLANLFKHVIEDQLKLNHVLTCPNPWQLDKGKYKQAFKCWEQGDLDKIGNSAWDYYMDLDLNMNLSPDFYKLAMLGRAQLALTESAFLKLIQSGDDTDVMKDMKRGIEHQYVKQLNLQDLNFLPDFSLTTGNGVFG